MPDDRPPSTLIDRERLAYFCDRLLGGRGVDHDDVGLVADGEPIVP
jgi:hypothetical protein